MSSNLALILFLSVYAEAASDPPSDSVSLCGRSVILGALILLSVYLSAINTSRKLSNILRPQKLVKSLAPTA